MLVFVVKYHLKLFSRVKLVQYVIRLSGQGRFWINLKFDISGLSNDALRIVNAEYDFNFNDFTLYLHDDGLSLEIYTIMFNTKLCLTQ